MAAAQAALWAELKATFEQDIPVTAELLEVLKKERQALESRDYDTFKQILADKQALLIPLETHAQVRQQLLREAGFEDEPSVLTAADVQAPVVARAWRQLKTQWKSCQELNEINERIAQRTRLVVGQMLDMLRGTTGDTKVYDNKGGTQSSGGGNVITDA